MTSEKRLQAVKDHPLFRQLVPRQQAFVLAYVATEDIKGSVFGAGYKPKTDHTADMLGRKMLKHVIIKQLISIGLGYETSGGILTKNELLLMMSDHIRKTSNATVFSRLVGIFTQLRGWTSQEQVPDISSAVLEMERRRKIRDDRLKQKELQ